MEQQIKVKAFCETLQRHAANKRKLYDGADAQLAPDFWLRHCVEELGEVAADMTRERKFNAVAECVDAAHTLMLLAISLDPECKVIEYLDN